MSIFALNNANALGAWEFWKQAPLSSALSGYLFQEILTLMHYCTLLYALMC
jgi:hypothetical protein